MTLLFTCIIFELVFGHQMKEMNKGCCHMTSIYEIWERQADKFYEMKRFVDDTDHKIDTLQVQ